MSNNQNNPQDNVPKGEIAPPHEQCLDNMINILDKMDWILERDKAYSRIAELEEVINKIHIEKRDLSIALNKEKLKNKKYEEALEEIVKLKERPADADVWDYKVKWVKGCHIAEKALKPKD